MNKPKDHLIVGLIFVALATVFAVLSIVLGWPLDFLAGFLTACAVYELDVYVAATRKFPKFTRGVLKAKRHDIEAINSTLTTNTPIYDEMGGRP